MLLNLVHVNVNVSDLDRSLTFYQTLGFRVMHRFHEDGAAGADGMEFRGTRVKGVVLSLGDDPRAATKIELLQWLEPAPETPPPRSLHSTGVGRIAIRTKGLLAFLERLEGEGIAIRQRPQEVDLVGARRFAIVDDPDGVPIELIEF